MTTFDTPEPISVDVEFGVGDLRIEAGDRTETTVEVRPSDPALKADVTAAEQSRVEFANGRCRSRGPAAGGNGCPAGAADRSTSRSVCPRARACASRRELGRCTAAAGSASVCARSVPARSGSMRQAR